MKRCLITGSAAGIGRALVQRYQHEGYDVTGIDITPLTVALPESSSDSNGPDVELRIQADLTDPGEVTRVLEELCSHSERTPFDVMIHNAGINCVGPFTASRWEHQRKLVALNLTTPMLLSAGLLRHNLIQSTATLVFISSLSHFVSYPGAAAYAASKDGLASYAASLCAFLQPHGGHVLTVYPGPTRTEHARKHSPDNSREHKRMHPDELAHRIHVAATKRRRVLIPGVKNHAFAAFGHFMPRMSEKAMKKALFDKVQTLEQG